MMMLKVRVSTRATVNLQAEVGGGSVGVVHFLAGPFFVGPVVSKQLLRPFVR